MTKTKAKAKKRKPPTREEAVNLLVAARSARAKIAAECRQLQAEFRAERDRRVSEMLAELTARGARVHERLGVLAKVTVGEERLKAMLGEEEKIIVDKHKVEDPSMSHAEIVAQRKRWPDAHDLGRITAKANMMALVGGFARFENKTAAEIAAAMRLLSLNQQAEISSAKGTDYSSPLVDVSWSGDAEKTMLSGDAARKTLGKLQAAVGDPAFDLLQAVIVRDVSVRAIAGTDATGRRVMAVADRVRRALAMAAEHWHLTGAPRSGGEVKGWDDGSPAVFVGEVVNAKRKTQPVPLTAEHE